MKDKLPILISVPHGGTDIPNEAREITRIGYKEILEDSDSFAKDIYNVENMVNGYITTNIARAYVDVNRAPDQLPPKNPDGLLKTATCFGKEIYTIYPKAKLRRKLIDTYYRTYHERIEQLLNNGEIKIGLDCHTMLQKAPPISTLTDINNERPTVCLGNNFGKSCSFEYLSLLSLCFIKVFQLKEYDININEPFNGGYIVQKYGNNPFPWIQVELNKKLYLKEPWFDENKLTIDQKRIKSLNKMFREILIMFMDMIRDL